MEQNHDEFAWLCGLVTGAESILEIGSRRGDSLQQFATRICLHGAKICSITADNEETLESLEQMAAKLRKFGFEVYVLMGDSHGPSAIEFAERHAPFDFIFIDGDHDYEGVRQDWEWYGSMGSVVAFHDIANPHHGVKQLWTEIKQNSRYPTHELSVIPEMYGIGVVFRHPFVSKRP